MMPIPPWAGHLAPEPGKAMKCCPKSCNWLLAQFFHSFKGGEGEFKIYCEKKYFPKSFASLHPGRSPDDRGSGFFLLAGF